MAATLLTADRSSARAAAAPGPAGPDPDEPSGLTEALFRLMADGRRRTKDEIGLALAAPASAIDEEIERLRGYGMSIEVAAGSVIAASVVPLDREALARALAIGGGHGRPTWDAEVVFATRSTNADLLATVRANPPVAPIVRAAEVQLAGRGRLGRHWTSSPGASLTASYAMTVGRPLSRLDGATLVCGLAVHAVLAGFGVHAQLKWPNDVLIDGAKVAGILIEAQAAGESSVLVIGIGVNVAGRTGATQRSGSSGGLDRTTLAATGAGDIDRNVLAARLARSLEAHLAAFEAGGFGAFVERWNAVDAFADRDVSLEAGPGSVTGVARGVDDHGALLVDVDGRRQRIVAGDVSLRPLDGTPA